MGIRIDIQFAWIIGLGMGIERRGSIKKLNGIIILPFMVLEIYKN
jgi:hypothetical protein